MVCLGDLLLGMPISRVGDVEEGTDASSEQGRLVGSEKKKRVSGERTSPTGIPGQKVQ